MIIFFTVLALLVFLTALLSFFFYGIAISTKSKKDTVLKYQKDLLFRNHKETLAKAEADFAGFCSEYPCSDLYINSKDGLKLHAYESKVAAGERWVIFIHGFTQLGARSVNTDKIKMHRERGFSALMVDLRGFGLSEGGHAGYGLQDKTDITGWIEYLNKTYANPDIVLDGISLGAAASCMVSDSELSPNVRCILAEGCYTTLEGLFKYQLTNVFHLPAYPVLWGINLACKLFAGYYFGEVMPVCAVASSKLPILFINGSLDRFVPPEMARRLYDAAPEKKELLIINGANHAGGFNTDSKSYCRAVLSFIDRYVSVSGVSAAP